MAENRRTGLGDILTLVIAAVPENGQYTEKEAVMLNGAGGNKVIIETKKHALASGKVITHKPAHMPVEAFPPSQEYVAALQSVEEKEG
jgi:hypothetical protein